MNIKVEIPEKLSDITLYQYQEYIKVANDKDIDNEMLLRNILRIFYKIDSTYFNKMKSKDIDYLSESVIKVLSQKPILEQRFKFEGVEYGIVPNFDDMTFGEFVDLENYTTIDDYHLMLSILYRPITERIDGRYLIEPYKGSHERFRAVSLNIALGTMGFFLTIGQQLLSVILKSSMEDHPQKMKQVLEGSGAGMSLLTRLQEGTLLNMTE